MSTSHPLPGSLERLCNSDRAEQIVMAAPTPGLDRIEARFTGNFFAPHAHEAYALGVTLEGVQCFGYRGERRASLPGQVIVLHPDEIHDGEAGTEQALRYRMLYIQPWRVRDAMGEQGHNRPLPFVPTPVISDRRLQCALLTLLGSGSRDQAEEADLVRSDLLAVVVDGLERHAGDSGRGQPRLICAPRLRRVRTLLEDAYAQPISSPELEAVSGLDRYTIARQFRAYFGTSPHRYLIGRRVREAAERIRSGGRIADVAQAVGFADQAHLTRHFKRWMGVTPGVWGRVSG